MRNTEKRIILFDSCFWRILRNNQICFEFFLSFPTFEHHRKVRKMRHGLVVHLFSPNMLNVLTPNLLDGFLIPTYFLDWLNSFAILFPCREKMEKRANYFDCSEGCVKSYVFLSCEPESPSGGRNYFSIFWLFVFDMHYLLPCHFCWILWHFHLSDNFFTL